MIAYVRGRVLTTTAETVVLDVHGIGYEIYCSGAVFKKIVVGEVAEIFTYLQVKEDGITLFGFESVKEKEIFLKLTSVSGVGPKLGIAVLTGLNADEFATAIATADVKKLSAVKGLGKKTAEKIVLELHGKISAVDVMNASADPLANALESVPAPVLGKEDEEAVSALMSLGFTKNESTQAVKRAKDAGAKTTEDIIRKALQGGM